jgi:uncharacterized NAD(P)/FAD-binding protein YdhS
MIVIAGGGASGAILAAHLLRSSSAKIILVEKSGTVGRGLAYSTTLPDHLLNVRAQNMSAFPDDPGHFVRWLMARKQMSSPDTFFFAPRMVYGDYLGDLLQEESRSHPGRLEILEDEVVAADPTKDSVRIEFASGSTLNAAKLVLATGHDIEPLHRNPFAIRMGGTEDTPLDPHAPVLILGSGLSMVDAVLSLEAANHKGPITVLSRRGLLPARQMPATPEKFTEDDLPMGKPASQFLHWLRNQISQHEAAGGNWRDVIDGLRPYNQRIWQNWSDALRRPFLRHGKAWWDTHRHRMAPEVHDRISAAIDQDRLAVRAARVTDITPVADGLQVTIRPRGHPETETLRVSRVYDCTGIIRNVEDSSRPLLRSLVAEGLAKADPLRLSLEVTRDFRLVSADGTPSNRIFALGPLTRGKFFEIDAIPEIRVQAAALGAMLAASDTPSS